MHNAFVLSLSACYSNILKHRLYENSGRMHNALVLSLSAYDSNVLSVIVRNLHHKAPGRLHTFTHIHLSHKRLG